MKSMPFLDPARSDDEHKVFLGISRAVIVESAVSEKLIVDDDLAFVPELLPILIKMSGELRDDLYRFHQISGTQIQFPLVQRCCCYAFAKGAESAFHWHKSSNGKVTLSYSGEGALSGAAGADVSEEFATAITGGMQIAGDVFCDFQNKVICDKSLGLNQGGRLLADVIAMGFIWFSQVGLDFGMQQLGYP